MNPVSSNLLKTSSYSLPLLAMLLAPFADIVADTTRVAETSRLVFAEEFYFNPDTGKCVNKNGDEVLVDPVFGDDFNENATSISPNTCQQLRMDWEFKHPLRSWECILDKMPAVQNDLAARITFSECKKLHGNERTTMRSFSVFGPSTRSECAQKYSAGTSSLLAARSIFAACNALYEK